MNPTTANICVMVSREISTDSMLRRIEMRDKDKEAKERMRAWRALPVEGRISWEGFKRQWAMMSDEQRKASK
jgi:hypothetical protein